MRVTVWIILLLPLAAGCSSPERVTVQAPISTVTEVTPLDADTIEKFIGAVIRLNQMELAEDAEYAFEPRVFDEDGRFSPFSSNIGILEGLEQRQEARRIIDAAGLGSVEEFAEVGDRIYRAYAAVVLEEEARAGSPQSEELLEIAESVPAADRIAVRRYFEELAKVLEPNGRARADDSREIE